MEVEDKVIPVTLRFLDGGNFVNVGLSSELEGQQQKVGINIGFSKTTDVIIFYVFSMKE